MPCSIPPSQIALFIAKYLAKLEAYVIAKIYEEVNKIIEKLMGQICPPVKEIEKILAIRDNLVNNWTTSRTSRRGYILHPCWSTE